MKFSDLQAKLAALREQSQNKPKPTLKTIANKTTESIIPVIPTNSVSSAGTDRHGNSITYNSRQQEAINLILSGQSCVIIGAAGTGKTTIQKAATAGLLQSGQILPQLNQDHKYLKSTSPGIAIVAYTRYNSKESNPSPDLSGEGVEL